MEGLVKEGQKTLSENATDEVMDAAIIAASQRIEHYEISGYGTAAHYADRLGYAEAASLLRQTLEEEQLTDTKLNDLAKNYINAKAE
jgi:ferritin-like metal-binding protein YciE